MHPRTSSWQRFEHRQPLLLGALLDAASIAIANESTIELDNPPRMADFAIWVAAACPALGWDADEFLRVYAANRAGATKRRSRRRRSLARSASSAGSRAPRRIWLEELSEIVGKNTARSKEWPKSPSALSGDLRRLASNLRRADPALEIEFTREGQSRRRVIGWPTSEWVRKRASAASAASATHESADGADGDLHTHSIGPDFASAIDEPLGGRNDQLRRHRSDGRMRRPNPGRTLHAAGRPWLGSRLRLPRSHSRGSRPLRASDLPVPETDPLGGRARGEMRSLRQVGRARRETRR